MSEPGEGSNSNGRFPNGSSRNGATPREAGVTGNGQSSVSASGANTLQAGANSSSLNGGTIQVEGLMDPCDTGGLNACATGVAAGRLGNDEERSSSTSPSSSPAGGAGVEDRWGRTQKYSAWQVLVCIKIGAR